MQSIRILAVAAGLAVLTACGGNEAANNADNAALENVDANADVSATDLNVGADLNAVDANGANAADANAANAADANAAAGNAQ